MSNFSVIMPPHLIVRLTALVAEHPGRTIDEHEAAARISDRLMIRTGLPVLVRRCTVRRDENGRLWPAGDHT